MVYIRAKKVKGTQYGYLVESKWDPKKKTSRQVTLKYLGKLDEITLEDLPEKYQNDLKISSFLTAHNPKNIKEKEKILKKLRRETFNSLTNGDLDSLLKMYATYASSIGIIEFYEGILKHVMYQIGDLWEKNQLDISKEHIASNVAHNLVKILGSKLARSSTKQKILICTPPGEFHNLGSNILESYLGSRGFQVFNITPSIPTEAIISFIKEEPPDAILVSITMSDSIVSAKKLIGKIKEKFKTPILVGGHALLGKNDHGFGTMNTKDLSMSDLAKILSTV